MSAVGSDAAIDARIIAVGDELRTGRRRDTNGPWMARRLTDLGLPPSQCHVVGDDPAALAAQLTHCAPSAGLVVVCGGLGPTDDDTTRDGVSLALGTPLREHPAAWAHVRAALDRMHRTPTAHHRTQARLPVGCDVLDNPAGTAPGIRATLEGAVLFVLPGVPQELEVCFERHVVPWVRTHVSVQPPNARTLWVARVPESEVVARLEPLAADDGIALATYPHHGEVEVVATGEANALDLFDAAARVAMGEAVFEAAGDERLQHATVAALRRVAATLATAESVTGGAIAALLTDVPGASDVFAQGWVTYHNDAKSTHLGVPAALIASDGVVSEAVAVAMATGARLRADATFGLATTGVAGPGPMSDGARSVAPGRVHVALATPDGARTMRLDAQGPRALVRRHACVAGLDLVRREALFRAR